MAMKVGEGKFSLKSGFDKYLRLDKAARMVGVSDAVGAMEMFDPVWEEGKMAVLGELNSSVIIHETKTDKSQL